MIFFWGPRMIFFCFSYEWPSYDFCFVLFLLLTDPRPKKTYEQAKQSNFLASLIEPQGVVSGPMELEARPWPA